MVDIRWLPAIQEGFLVSSDSRLLNQELCCGWHQALLKQLFEEESHDCHRPELVGPALALVQVGRELLFCQCVTQVVIHSHSLKSQQFLGLVGGENKLVCVG